MLGSVNVGQPRNDRSAFVTNEQVGVPGGVATLNAEGKLSASQVPDIDHYTQSQTDEKIGSAVSSHDSSETAHPDFRASIEELKTTLDSIDLKYGTSITSNAFTVTFANLGMVTVTGVWNQGLARIEF